MGRQNEGGGWDRQSRWLSSGQPQGLHKNLRPAFSKGYDGHDIWVTVKGELTLMGSLLSAVGGQQNRDKDGGRVGTWESLLAVAPLSTHAGY